MVAREGGQFKEQLWRTVRTIALAFLLISGVGALIEDRGISKGLTISQCLRSPMIFLMHPEKMKLVLNIYVSIMQGLD